MQRKVHECRGCDLYRRAAQAVFGEGPPGRASRFVGEQSGKAEDLAGHPFVGPAERVFDKALATAGIDPSSILRAPDSEAREAAFATLVSDLELVAKALRKPDRAPAARKA